MPIYSHKVLPGQTLSQIADLYVLTAGFIGQNNDIIAEIADDNDLTGAELNIMLPLTEESLDSFHYTQRAFISLVHKNDQPEENLNQLFNYLYFYINDLYNRLLQKEQGYPMAVQDLQSAHIAWLQFCGHDDKWGMAMCHQDAHDRGIKPGTYDETQLRLRRAEVMRARVEQLHANEVEFDSRMVG